MGSFYFYCVVDEKEDCCSTQIGRTASLERQLPEQSEGEGMDGPSQRASAFWLAEARQSPHRGLSHRLRRSWAVLSQSKSYLKIPYRDDVTGVQLASVYRFGIH